MLGAVLLQPLEEEVKTVGLLRLRLTKETAMEMIQGRVVVPRVRTVLLEMIRRDRVAPRLQNSRIGGIQHGEARVVMSLIIVVKAAVSVT